jgi:hypothetical protein
MPRLYDRKDVPNETHTRGWSVCHGGWFEVNSSNRSEPQVFVRLNEKGRAVEVYAKDDEGIDPAILEGLGVSERMAVSMASNGVSELQRGYPVAPVAQVVESVGTSFGMGGEVTVDYERGAGLVRLLNLGQSRLFWKDFPNGVLVEAPHESWLESPESWESYQNFGPTKTAKRPIPKQTNRDLRRYWTVPKGKTNRVFLGRDGQPSKAAKEEFLHRVGHWYMDLITVTDAPAQYISDSCNAEGYGSDPVKPGHVHRWIREARASGFIPRLEPGSNRSLRFDEHSYREWAATHGRQ